MHRQVLSKRKRTGSHFTPRGLARFVGRKLLHHLPKKDPVDGLKVLDPACGDGELLLALTELLPCHFRRSCRLIGIDNDPETFQRARHRLRNLEVQSIDLRQTDFLSHCSGATTTSNVNSGTLLDNIDVIIANPPYVRTQILGSEASQQLASTFGLSGKVDLYHAFLVAMRNCLDSAGLMGVITSNRFIATKSGMAIRKLLINEFEVLELIDLGDTRIFDAAVLPAVIIARRRHSTVFNMGQSPPFVKIYETNDKSSARRFSSIYESLQDNSPGVVTVKQKRYQVTTGTVGMSPTGKDPWTLVSDDEKQWLRHIIGMSSCTVADVADVKVGVKTTADSVFIREKWNDLPKHRRPEPTVLYPLISASNTAKWKLQKDSNGLRKILYPHTTTNGCRTVIPLQDFPGAAAYFESHSATLKSRDYLAKSNRKWFELWVPQDPSAWRSPKIVFPDISASPRFLLDTSGAIVNGNCYWMTNRQHDTRDWLYLILGIANSKLMTKFHDLSFNNRLYSSRRRYLTQYVGKYPLPSVDSPESKSIIELVRQLLAHASDGAPAVSLETQLDEAVMAAFNTSTCSP